MVTIPPVCPCAHASRVIFVIRYVQGGVSVQNQIGHAEISACRSGPVNVNVIVIASTEAVVLRVDVLAVIRLEPTTEFSPAHLTPLRTAAPAGAELGRGSALGARVLRGFRLPARPPGDA